MVYDTLRILETGEKLIICGTNKKILYPHNIISENRYSPLYQKLVKVISYGPDFWATPNQPKKWDINE